MSARLRVSGSLDECEQLPILLTVEELAQLLRLTRKGVYGLVSQRRIPHLKVGRVVRFKRTDVLDWLQGNRVAALEE